MKDFFYFGSIRKSIIKFLSIFDEIKIGKYDNEGNITKYVDVPIKFMPKKKFYSWLYERSHEKRFPVIGVEITGIEYDSSRQTGNYEKVKLSSTEDSVTYQQMPVPYNISFELHIATEYMSEMDQIVEQILPFFSPYVFTTIKVDEVDFSGDSNILFESCNIQTETDIAEDDYRKVLGTMTFSMETYLLKPTSNINTIRKVVNKIYLSEYGWDQRSTTDTPSGGGPEDLEVLVLGSIEDGEKLIKYEYFYD